MQYTDWRIVGLLAALSISFAAAAAAVMWGVRVWTGASWGDAANVVLAVGTLTAIFVGGGFAYYRLQILRTFHPHLTISHEVSHRSIGDSYIHVALTAHLQNTSRVVVSLRRGVVTLDQVSPIDDRDIARLYDSLGNAREAGDILWPTLERHNREWEEGDLIVEPGETYPEPYEFVIPRGVRTVIAYTYYEDTVLTKQRGKEMGWHALTTYDILEAE